MHKTLVARRLVRGPTKLIPGNTGAAAPVPFCRRTGLLPAQEKKPRCARGRCQRGPTAVLQRGNQHRHLGENQPALQSTGWMDLVSVGTRWVPLTSRHNVTPSSYTVVGNKQMRTLAKGHDAHQIMAGQLQQSRWGMHSQRTTLAWPGGKNAWTLAGFQIRRPGGKKEGFDSNTPTQTATTPTRGGLGACIDPAVSAQVRLLKHKPQRGSSCPAPDEGAGGYKSRSNLRSHDWRAAVSRSGGGVRIGL